MASPDEMAAQLDPTWVPPQARQYYGQRGPLSYVLRNYLPEKVKETAQLPWQVGQAVQQYSEGGDYNPAPVMHMAALLAGTRAPTIGAGEAGIFGGRLGKTADLSKLRAAEEMARFGTDPLVSTTTQRPMPGELQLWGTRYEGGELLPTNPPALRQHIYDKTGWFQGTDGHWRYYIPDTGATTTEGSGLLGHILQHPGGALRAYPEFNTIATRLTHGTDVKGYFYPKPISHGGVTYPGVIEMAGPNQAERTAGILHELQHAIQEKEGFAPGANLGKIKEELIKKARPEGSVELPPKMRDEIEQKAWNQYDLSAGELESMNVERRFMHDFRNPTPSYNFGPWAYHRRVHPSDIVYDPSWLQKQKPEIRDFVKALRGLP